MSATNASASTSTSVIVRSHEHIFSGDLEILELERTYADESLGRLREPTLWDGSTLVYVLHTLRGIDI